MQYLTLIATMPQCNHIIDIRIILVMPRRASLCIGLSLPYFSISAQLHVPSHLSTATCQPAASCHRPTGNCLWHLQHEYAFNPGWRVRFTCRSLIHLIHPPTSFDFLFPHLGRNCLSKVSIVNLFNYL